MKHTISIQDGIVLVVASETATPEGYGLVARDIVSLPQWKPGMNILIDYSFLDLSHVTGKDAHLYASAVTSYKSALGNGRLAGVNSKPVDFGLGRVWQVFMQEFTDLEVSIFYTFDEALRWLISPDIKSK